MAKSVHTTFKVLGSLLFLALPLYFLWPLAGAETATKARATVGTEAAAVAVQEPKTAGSPESIPVRSKAYAVIDGAGGQLLYAQECYEPLPPASTTKVLTAITALDSAASVEQLITVSARAAKTGEATVHLRENDVLTLEELLYGAMLESGNDACVAIAEGLAPSEEEFVARMNLKAFTLGAYRTRFYNTNGLPDPLHVTCAADLALIARYALANPTFAEIVKTQNHTMTWVEPQRKLRLKNLNLLLWLDERITGVKTGSTKAAGRCLVGSIDIDGRQLIGVVLNSQDRYRDMQALFSHGNQKLTGDAPVWTIPVWQEPDHVLIPD
ncbi:MAG: serine hydrolase [Clostridiales bacterium]